MTGVRRVTTGDESLLRELRLRALKEAPSAFGSTFEGEVDWPIETWRERVEQRAWFIADDVDGPCGLAAGMDHESDPMAAFLVSMWIAPAARGSGLAAALVKAVIAWSISMDRRALWLHVTRGNDRARVLYERHGFRCTGVELVRERDGAIEEEMVLDLSSDGASTAALHTSDA